MTTIDITSQIIPYIFFFGIFLGLVAILMPIIDESNGDKDHSANIFLIGLACMIPETIQFIVHVVMNTNLRW